jgi:hypothetical protein
MKRMVAPNDTMREVTIEGARFGGSKTYGWSKDGTVHVESAAHAKALKEAGFTEAGVCGATSRGGFVCTACGFHMWFKTCSRCGGEGVRNG